LTAKEWILSQIGIWKFSYESRDIRDKNVHPATFPISLAKKCIELFTHEGELVLDPFVGSGTTLVAGQDVGRNVVGFDLKPEYVATSLGRVQTEYIQPVIQTAICDDARRINSYLDPESINLIVTSPPYSNLLNRPRQNKSRRGKLRKNEQYLKVEQYSQDENDLGILDLDQYAEAITSIFTDLLPLLKEKAHCVINVPDIWWENHRITIHISVIQAMQAAGYELRNTIIWDRTNIVNRLGIFGWPSNYITMGTTFEYLLDFWRPPSK
jgi:DNA modification methylase|tara:strand:+ start:233 stop:1036 length:804 start_codon:yes stop_codon:yes gene_type:complete